jgi:hypothetical protein
MFQLTSLRCARTNGWKKPLNRGSGFFKTSHDINKDDMKKKHQNATKRRKQNQKTKEK